HALAKPSYRHVRSLGRTKHRPTLRREWSGQVRRLRWPPRVADLWLRERSYAKREESWLTHRSTQPLSCLEKHRPKQTIIINMPTVMYNYESPDALDLPWDSDAAARIIPYRF